MNSHPQISWGARISHGTARHLCTALCISASSYSRFRSSRTTLHGNRKRSRTKSHTVNTSSHQTSDGSHFCSDPIMKISGSAWPRANDASAYGQERKEHLWLQRERSQPDLVRQLRPLTTSKRCREARARVTIGNSTAVVYTQLCRHRSRFTAVY